MTIEQARKLVGNQPVWALRNMIVALSLHSWLNTEADNLRLKAAKMVIRHGRK
jgi:hypothetical protein